MLRMFFIVSTVLFLNACSNNSTPATKPKTIITQNTYSEAPYLRTVGFHRFGFNRTFSRNPSVYTVSD